MTGILEQLKWESLKKRRDSRLIMLYKGLKGAASVRMTLSLQVCTSGSITRFAFQTPFANTDMFKSSFFFLFFFFFFFFFLRPVKIISHILSRVIRKVGRKREIRDKNHLTTRKQNLACLTSGPSWARTHSGEMASDLERCILASLTTRSRGPPNAVSTPRLFEIGILLQIFSFLLLKMQKTLLLSLLLL